MYCFTFCFIHFINGWLARLVISINISPIAYFCRECKMLFLELWHHCCRVKIYLSLLFTVLSNLCCVILFSHMAGLQKYVKSSTVFVFLFVNVPAISTQPLCSAEIAITEINLIFCVAVIFRITQWSGCRQT